ncbi:MAG: glutamine amidotransferase [Azoarcus sp.]|jgi:GMP synthase (glutamine-hydrolysing)|nr:glutamine amidotransferase [Azoarcus sp.]
MNGREMVAAGGKPLLILQTGSASLRTRQQHGDYDRMFVRAAELEAREAQGLLRRVHVERGERPENPRIYAGVLITGSDAMVSDRLPWSEAAAGWLRGALDAGLPVFGVCYGHQLLAHALGGVVEDHPAGLEAGTRDIFLRARATAEPMLAGTPQRFAANLFHRQTVVAPPAGAVALAASAHDPHQILRYAPMVWSVQFHPEFDGTIMAALLAEEEEVGKPAPARRGDIADAPHARALLRRFVESIPEPAGDGA